jgi:hypothetical protein
MWGLTSIGLWGESDLIVLLIDVVIHVPNITSIGLWGEYGVNY